MSDQITKRIERPVDIDRAMRCGARVSDEVMRRIAEVCILAPAGNRALFGTAAPLNIRATY